MGVVGFACFYIVQKSIEREEGLTSVIGKLSILYILAGLAVLLSLIYHQGCVPNTKPLLDYYDLVKVCKICNTPGIFWGVLEVMTTRLFFGNRFAIEKGREIHKKIIQWTCLPIKGMNEWHSYYRVFSYDAFHSHK